MIPSRLTSDEVCKHLHLSLVQLEELRTAGAPHQIVDGAPRWQLNELIDFLAQHQEALWGGVLP